MAKDKKLLRMGGYKPIRSVTGSEILILIFFSELIFTDSAYRAYPIIRKIIE